MLVSRDISPLPRSAVALGFFDGLHPGHEAVIRAAGKKGCETVVFSIGSAARSASRLLTDEDRDSLLEGLGVDRLLMPDFESIKSMSGEEFFSDILLGRLGARRVACGFNFRFGRNAACGAQELEALCRAAGVECSVLPPVCLDGKLVSSSALRALLDEGRADEYERLSGRRYSYCLEVVHGRSVGRAIGFPTMNQVFPEYLKLPRYGVYASIVRTPDGVLHPGVTNIGVRPTVGSDAPLSETFIEDYAAELYGQSIRVELVGFIRPEQRFGGLEELRCAISRDAEQARSMTATLLPD